VRTHFVSICIAILLCCRAFGAHAEETADTTKPFFLVASTLMPDPIFQESVILMFPAAPSDPIIAGLIINKPTRVTLDEFFHQLPGLQHHEQVAYFGGPVDDNLPIIVMREPNASVNATRVMDKVFVAAGVSSITSIVTKSWSPKDDRIFFGRAQWGRDQLRMELLRGAWDVQPASASLVFSDDVKGLWRSLNKKTGLHEVVWPLATKNSEIDRELQFTSP
jgi:putative AlgH/UPF0301 family transcriptional regulator